jgi:polyhydroxyalkanoate synthesis regulator phasin
MEGIVGTVSEYPLVAVAVCFAVLMIVYFLFKSLIKFALILIIVAAAIGGCYYFLYPDSRPANFEDAVEKVRTGAGEAVDQGKEAYEKGKELVDKGKETYEKGRELVDKGIDKGKDAIEKGSDTVGAIGKILKGEQEAGARRQP